MPTEHIIALLIQERDRLNRAIEALQGGARRRGRPPKDLALSTVETATPKKRHVSAAARRKMRIAQKKRWAAVKKAAEK